MANYPTQWQIVENNAVNYYCYISKWGNDSTGDGSANNPYKTINAGVTYLESYAGALNRILVIGTGLYINESISVSRSGNKPIQFYGEGKVIIDGSGSNYIIFGQNAYGTVSDTLYNLIFQGYGVKYYFANGIGNYGSHIDVSINMTNCTFSNGIIGSVGGYYTYYSIVMNLTNCTFNSCGFWATYVEGYSASYFYANGCNFINCYSASSAPQTLKQIINSNFITSTNLSFNPSNSVLEFNFNNIIGNITYSGNPVNLTWFQNNTSYNVNSIASNPLFNDSPNGNYTLQSDSPCLRTGKDAANIGVFGRGFYYTAQNLWDNRDTNYCFNIQYLNGLCLVDSGEKTGRLKTKYFDLGAKIKISKTNIIAIMQYLTDGTPAKIVDYENGDYFLYDSSGDTVYFDGDTCSYNPGTGLAYYRCNMSVAPGTSGAFNPTYWDVITGTREKSLHYDYKLRYSKTSMDLDNYGTTVHLLSNGDCVIDSNGVGNASPTFNISGSTYNIIMRYFDLDIKLKDVSSS